MFLKMFGTYRIPKKHVINNTNPYHDFALTAD